MADNIGIYKITNPLGRVYIGQSFNLAKREKFYKGHRSQMHQKLLFRSIVKHGWSNHCFEIICHLPEGTPANILNRKEFLFWKKYNDAGFNMLNLREPNGSRGRHSIESRKSMSETRKKLFITNPEYFRGCAVNKPIFQYSLNGEFIHEWESTKLASTTLGIERKSITQAVNQKSKSCNGYQWRFIKKDRIDPIAPFKLNRSKSTPVLQFTKDGELINEYPSQREAARCLKLDETAIAHAVRGKVNSSGGFIWKYKTA